MRSTGLSEAQRDPLCRASAASQLGSRYGGAVVDAARLLGRNQDGKPYYVVPIISRDRGDILPQDCLA